MLALLGAGCGGPHGHRTQLRKPREPPGLQGGITVLLVDQNVRQCVAVSDYTSMCWTWGKRARKTSARFAHDAQLRGMIAE